MGFSHFGIPHSLQWDSHYIIHPLSTCASLIRGSPGAYPPRASQTPPCPGSSCSDGIASPQFPPESCVHSLWGKRSFQLRKGLPNASDGYRKLGMSKVMIRRAAGVVWKTLCLAVIRAAWNTTKLVNSAQMVGCIVSCHLQPSTQGICPLCSPRSATVPHASIITAIYTENPIFNGTAKQWQLVTPFLKNWFVPRYNRNKRDIGVPQNLLY